MKRYLVAKISGCYSCSAPAHGLLCYTINVLKEMCCGTARNRYSRVNGLVKEDFTMPVQ